MTLLISRNKFVAKVKGEMLNSMKDRTILFEVDGVVLEGSKKGNKLGFPTANLFCADSVPGGIYAGEVIWKERAYPAAIYKSNAKDIIEAYLLDFSDNLYGEAITIIGHHKVRESHAFANKEELIAAISKDIEDIKKLCSQE